MKYILILILSISPLHAFDQNHSLWGKILKNNIVEKKHQTLFKYKKLKKNPKLLNQYLSELSKLDKKTFASFSSNEKLAFWINVYNAFTIKLIIDHYPIKSIKDIGGILSNPWKKKFFTIFGKKYHLDNIEHDIIRKEFNEPKIHFAVNCASIGCPNLLNRPFTGQNLESQLEASTVRFFADPSKNKIIDTKTLGLSKIFKWYGDDFKKKYSSYQAFSADYLSTDVKLIKKIGDKKLKVKWLDYNWSLNEAL